MRLFILGATGGTGRALIAQAVDRGHRVTAFVRSPEKLGELRRNERVSVCQGDPRSSNELRAALPEHDAVVSALGPGGLGRSTILEESAHAVVPAMESARIGRLLVVSAAVLFENEGLAVAVLRRTLLRNVAKDSLAMERVVTASSLDWTISRPPRLTDGALTKRYAVANDRIPDGARSVSRADVAHYLLDELEHRAHVHRIVGMTALT